MSPTLSVVICSYNRQALLSKCLGSLIETGERLPIEIIVIDNGSTDGSVEMTRRDYPSVRLFALSHNLGFCGANNLGVAESAAANVMLLNHDAVVLGDAALELVRFLVANEDVKCVGPRVVLPNGAPQPRVFGHLPTLWRIAMQSLYLHRLFPGVPLLEGVDGVALTPPEQTVGWISGVCMVMRKNDYLAVGGFDESFFMYCEDLDLCCRLSQRGGRIVRLERAEVLHYGGGVASNVADQVRNTRLQQRNLLTVVRRQSGPVAARCASLMIFLGLLPRLFAGLVLVPTRGASRNALLQSSLMRMSDLVRQGAGLGRRGSRLSL